MVLKDTHDTLEEIPSEYQSLYTEKNGKFELTGIQGVKTQGDVDRLQSSLHKAQEDNKGLKTKLKIWDGMDHDDVTTNLDRIPELESAAKGTLDDAQVEEIVSRRVDGTLRSKLAPVERRNKELETENAGLKEVNVKFVAADVTRTVHDKVRKALVESKVLPDAHEDALLLADRSFEITEDGRVVTRDNIGITPGLDAAGWLTELQDRRRHWWPESVGGGARGSGGGGSGGGANPFTNEHWDLTKQGQFLLKHGPERTEQLAKAAGTTPGGRKPPPKK